MDNKHAPASGQEPMEEEKNAHDEKNEMPEEKPEEPAAMSMPESENQTISGGSTTGDGDGHSNEEKFLSALCYLPMGFILAMVTSAKSEFCRFHVRQGIALFVSAIVVLIVLAFFALFLGPVLIILFILGYFALVGYAGYNAYEGKSWPIPVLSKFTGKIDIDKINAMPMPGTKKPEDDKTLEKEEKKEESGSEESDLAEK